MRVQEHMLQVVARCKEDIIKAKGVKPTLSPNLNTLATVEALDVKKLLFIGVGCQVRCCHQSHQHQELSMHYSHPHYYIPNFMIRYCCCLVWLPIVFLLVDYCLHADFGLCAAT